MANSGSLPLSALLERLPAAAVSGSRAQRVTAIEIDSRAVGPGALFVALRGARTDGHRFVGEALARGAAGVVIEAPAEPSDHSEGTVIVVPDTKRALSVLAAAFYGEPSSSMDAIGVTGTNGKTTTTRMIAAILNHAAIPCGVIGTVGAEFEAARWELANTTPLPPELHRLLAGMKAQGARAVAMEVSSHALALGRVDDVHFTVAALTNVTRDHLDFHESAQAYRDAKRRLFALSPRSVLNADDECGSRWASELRGEGRDVVTYGVSREAALLPTAVRVAPDGSRFTLDGRRYELHVAGRFNIWNALAAIGVARFLGVDDEAIAQGLASLRRVPGRMERLHGAGIDVVVDYAHTPDALENALRSLRETTPGALAVVFGCGGDRDRGKRAEMGAVAARLADRIYLTSDNPRGEEPQRIVDDILAGLREPRACAVELDRRHAIERAIAEAQTGDVVLVAGKGHETYQIVGDRVLHFNDAEVAREALAPLSV
jgi:UDP-N-acetylmuramoyl-L-alanyl-D-glutamate--2,6-diaminopimelate ligase